jgi:ABC-type glycerol-3-phosphate transport system substrate-binding protein
MPYNEWHIFIHQNGGRIWTEDGRRCVINSPEAREAMTFLYDLFERRRVGPSLLDPNERIYQESFRSGRAAMYI